MTTPQEKIVYIVFANSGTENFFNPNGENGEWIEYSLKKRLEDLGYTVQFSIDGANLNPSAAVISWDVNEEILKNLSSIPRKQCSLIAFEPPHVAPIMYSEETRKVFGRILIFFDDLVDNQNYFRFYYPFRKAALAKPKEIPSFEEKKFCVGIQGNKYFHPHPDELYTERKQAFNFFTRTGEFDIYGPNWVGYPNWKGMIPDPLNQTYKNYKFSLIFENWKNHKGYITERLFAGMSSRSIPAYWGASDITDYVPKDCFIDLRDFPNYQEVYRFMKSMSKETYQTYIDAIDHYFATTDKLKPFEKDNWIQTITSHLS